MTDHEIVRWCIQFAGRDFTTLRAGDWINLREDLTAIAFWLPEQPDATFTPRQEKQLAKRNLQKIQRVVRDFLTTHAQANTPQQWVNLATGRKTPHVPLGAHPIGFEVTSVKVLTFRLLDLRTARLHVWANLRDTLLFVLAGALSHVNIGYLRKCEACGQLFLASDGRQWFDRPQCSYRLASARYRDKQAKTGRKKRNEKQSPSRRTAQRQKSTNISKE